MVTTLFFFWGFVTVLNDILVPHLKAIFDLNYTKVMLIQFAFFSAYFLFSLPWAKVVNAIGYQKTMVAGLLCMTVGAFLFVPAASAASFPLFLGALIVLAERPADVDALVRQLHLADRPHHLLHVGRGVAPPDLQHGLAPPSLRCGHPRA